MTSCTAADSRRDRGSVLMLFPATVVIILLLGALVVDSAIVFLAQRNAHSLALDAANDASGAGLDGASFRSGAVRIDPARAAAVAADSVRAADADGVEVVDVDVDATGAVTVVVRYQVDRLFGSAFGAPDSSGTITATSVGEDGTDE